MDFLLQLATHDSRLSSEVPRDSQQRQAQANVRDVLGRYKFVKPLCSLFFSVSTLSQTRRTLLTQGSMS